jgi:dynein heavy chain
VVGIFCNPALCERHWNEMSEVAGFDLTPNAGTTLNKIINMHLEKHLDRYVSKCSNYLILLDLHKIYSACVSL